MNKRNSKVNTAGTYPRTLRRNLRPGIAQKRFQYLVSPQATAPSPTASCLTLSWEGIPYRPIPRPLTSSWLKEVEVGGLQPFAALSHLLCSALIVSVFLDLSPQRVSEFNKPGFRLEDVD